MPASVLAGLAGFRSQPYSRHMARPKPSNEHSLHQLDWNLLKVFSVLVETGGLTRAAAKLGRKQPAISLALKRLEERLGTRLCRRGPGGFALTEEGRRLAATCVRMSDMIRHLPEDIADATQTVSGPIRIRLISNLVHHRLDDAIAAFHQKYPLAELQVDVATWSDVVNALLRQEIDIGVAPSQRKRAELTYFPLFTELHRPYCGRRHALFGKRVAKAPDLAGEAFILTGSDEPDQLSDFRLKHGLGRNIAAITEHLEEARRLTVVGVGLCFLPEGYAAPDVAAGRLWPLLGARGLPSMDIYVITNPNGPPKHSRRLLIEEFKATITGGKALGAEFSRPKPARVRP